MAEKQVLVVDDEAGIRDIIREYMEAEGYGVREAVDGVDGINKFKQATYDLVVLDVMMPKLDGWTVCREIRKVSPVPIIMLTARGEEYDKLFGFELGVDDYMVKPFSPRELMARAKAVMARRAPAQAVADNRRLVYGNLELDRDGRALMVDGSSVPMTPKAYELVCFLMENPNKAFSREQLLETVWGFDFYGDNRTVDTHIKMLREQLGAHRNMLETVWGMGYKFNPEVKLS